MNLQGPRPPGRPSYDDHDSLSSLSHSAADRGPRAAAAAGAQLNITDHRSMIRVSRPGLARPRRPSSVGRDSEHLKTAEK